MNFDISVKPISRTSPATDAGDFVTERRKGEADAKAKNDIHPKEVDRVASQVQILLKRLNTELRLEVRKESKSVVVKIVDPETKTVLRQIPSEELLSIQERMGRLAGVFLKVKT